MLLYCNTNAPWQHCPPCECTHEDGDTMHRFLVDGKKIKYIRAHPGVLCMRDCSAAPSSTILPQLPKFPSGDWNLGIVYRNETGRIYFRSYLKTYVPGAKKWHPTRIDQMDLTGLERIDHNVFMVSHSSLEKGMAVFDHFPDTGGSMQRLTALYKAINGLEICSKFVGHLMEEGRVIGCLLEHIDEIRLAGPQDLGESLRTLRKLHKLGYKHGRILTGLFYVSRGKVLLSNDPEEFKEELDIAPFMVAGISPRFATEAQRQAKMTGEPGENENKSVSKAGASLVDVTGATSVPAQEAEEKHLTTTWGENKASKAGIPTVSITEVTEDPPISLLPKTGRKKSTQAES